MVTLRFNMKKVAKIYDKMMDHKNNGGAFLPSSSALMDPSNYPGGVLLNSDGKTKQQCEEQSALFRPCSSQWITPPEPEFILVADEGVYLTGNMIDHPEEKKKERRFLCHALKGKTCESPMFRALMQLSDGSDTSERLPLEIYHASAKHDNDQLILKVSRDSISQITYEKR